MEQSSPHQAAHKPGMEGDTEMVRLNAGHNKSTAPDPTEDVVGNRMFLADGSDEDVEGNRLSMTDATDEDVTGHVEPRWEDDTPPR